MLWIVIGIFLVIIAIVLIYESNIKTKEFNNIMIHLSTTINLNSFIQSLNNISKIKRIYNQDGLSFVLFARNGLISEDKINCILCDHLRFNHLDKTSCLRLICFYNKHKINCKTEPSLFYQQLYECYHNNTSRNLAFEFLQNHQNYVIGSGERIIEPVSSDSKSTSYHWFRLVDLGLISPNNIDETLYRYLFYHEIASIQDLLGRYPKPLLEGINYVKPNLTLEIKKEMIQQQSTPAINSKSTCCICLENPPDVIYLPCFHFVGCKACSEKVKTCPICRSKIKEKRTVFILK